jgi:hypothetical protein
MMYGKCSEIIFEGVPGLLLQLYGVLTLSSSSSSSLTLFSIATSAITTSFSASVMYFDKDVDPKCREWNPLFYGVFPTGVKKRLIAFSLLWLFSVAHVLSKALGVALLWATFGGPTVFRYYGAELGIVYLVKIVRCDFFCWLPIPSAVGNAAASVIFRFANKVLADFTGFLQMRHCYELGK